MDSNRFSEYYEARSYITEIIKKDLLGPVLDDEVLTESPLSYYLVGKLYPQGQQEIMDDTAKSEDIVDCDEECLDCVNQEMPSSMGITFCVSEGTDLLYIQVKTAIYDETIIADVNSKHNKRLAWKRRSIDKKFAIKVDDLLKERRLKLDVISGMQLKLFLHNTKFEDLMITASVINVNRTSGDNIGDNALAFFQTELIINLNEDVFFLNVKKNLLSTKDSELINMQMLYSDVGDFAAGHGCATDWVNNKGKCNKILTTVLPKYELKQMMPNTHISGQWLSMKYLSEISSQAVISDFNKFIDMYSKWIVSQETELLKKSDIFIAGGKTNIKLCYETRDRMKKAVQMLADSDVFYAFKLANKAMFIQRKNTLKIKGILDNDESITWYPFQLAFFIQEIPSIVNKHDEDHKLVDLLWFPTGGGKTEAYLGLAAFTVFLSRIRYGQFEHGVTVIMRYTLRMLALQQFERANAMICACEKIRREEHLSNEPITIGLWAGDKMVPNSLRDAKKYLQDCQTALKVTLIKKCPWCGAEITVKDYKIIEQSSEMLVKCPNIKCDYHSGLPIKMIDEDMYEHRPTFVIATIDKFAQLAFKEKSFNLLESKDGKFHPELIIQDEMHLISGPLGTIAGIYEGAVLEACSSDGIQPKIIASTATVKNAVEQIKGLYGTKFMQFPPQGISINDSFFAILSQPDEKPTRLYMGCKGVNTSATTSMIRCMAVLLFATRWLKEKGLKKEVVDSFWTITCYYLSLRELGGALIRVNDDIQDRYAFLRETKFKGIYEIKEGKHSRHDIYEELTSRAESSKISASIAALERKSYEDPINNPALDFVLASNMISVGIDVGRLNSMFVVGQPKTTAEYIQASSRVGRQTPGFVLTFYNKAKSRDLSHYEQFRQYHETFYKFVESTSVTPFSSRARDRALQALFVILCRSKIKELRADDSAKSFKRDMAGIKDIEGYILNRVKVIDKTAIQDVQRELNDIKNEWENRANKRNISLVYNPYVKKSGVECLFDDEIEEDSRFRRLNTMRSVEPSVTVEMR